MEPLSHTSGKRIKDSIYELSFGEYVEVALGNFTFLSADPATTPEELSIARQTILAEFTEIAGGSVFALDMKDHVKQMRVGLQLMGLTLALNVITTSYDKGTLDFLIEEEFLPKSTEYPSNVKELAKLTTWIKNRIDKLKFDIQEMDAINEKSNPNKGQKTPVRRDFTKLLANLVRFTKASITFETNAAVVAELVNHMKEAQEEMERSKLKK